MQRFHASEPFRFSNGATGWRPGGPFDCLGPYAKVQACPVSFLEWCPYPGRENEPHGEPGCGTWRTVNTALRLTCYAQGYADSFFSVPAAARFQGRRIRGYFTHAETGSDAVVFMACTADVPHLVPVKRERIRERNYHGERFTRGDRKAEALRVDSCCGTWAVFCYVGGTMQRGTGPDRASYGEAIRAARQFVKGAA